MSLTKILFPAALVLALWGAVMAVSGIRQHSKLKLFSGLGAFAVLASSAALLMEFITRPL